MKILVTGATGFIGRHLVRSLISQKHEVSILARNTTKAKKLFGNSVTIHEGDIRCWSSFEQLPTSFEYIFHLAAVINHKKSDLDTVASTNIHGTKLTIRYARNLPNLKRFVHISSIAVYGAANTLPATENSLRLPKSPYEVTKNISEKIVIKSANTFNFPYTIIRPPVVFGKEDNSSAILMLNKLVKKGLAISLTRQSINLQTIFIDDLVTGICLAAFDTRTKNEDYILVGPVVTLNQISNYFSKVYGKKKWPGFIPKSVLYLLSYFFSDPHSIFFLLSNRKFNASKLKKNIGFSAETSLEEGLKKSLSWYQNYS